MIDFKKLMIEEKKRILLEKEKALKEIEIKEKEKQETIINNNDNIKQEEELKKVDFNKVNIENLLNLKQFKYGTIESIYYIKEFISESEQDDILKNVYSDENKDKWTQLKRRRLQNWGGTPISSGMIEEPLPQWLDSICDKIYNSSIFPTKPNHVLLNEYNINEGIMPHTDGPLFYPCVCILSLGSTCLMNFYKNIKEEPIENIFLKPRSLLIFTQDAYKTYFHGIKESYSDLITENVINKNEDGIDVGKEFDRDVRVSLTIRIVPNTINKK